MANNKADAHFDNDPETEFTEQVLLDQQELIFDARFQRCYRMLHFVACRVLGGPERAEGAVESCRRVAFRHFWRFEHEGEFRRWLLRVLIAEALVLLRESVPNAHNESVVRTSSCASLPEQRRIHGKEDVRTDDQNRLTEFFCGSGIVEQKRHLDGGTISNERNQ